MITPSVQIVLDWHAALNAQDVERLVSLSAEDIKVGGPRGVGNGVDLLRDWVERARIRMEPLDWQAHGTSVVVLERAQWQTPDDESTQPQQVASVFRVEDRRATSVIRYADFDAALDAAGMKGQV